MIDTRTRILDTAQDLIQTRGFSAMSFQDIAVIVGIKKPSIIHHFASKFALGKAVIERYHETMKQAMQAIQADPARTAWDAIEFYFSPYLDFGETGDKVCLCGALAGEILELGPSMQQQVRIFFTWHELWLEQILKEGQSSGEFTLKENPHRLARTLLSALQGALLVKRVTGDASQLQDVIETIRDLIRPT